MRKLLILLALVGCETTETLDVPEVFSLEGGTFPGEINVIITPDVEAAAQYIRENLDSTVQACDLDGMEGVTFDFQEGKPGIIWLERASFEPADIALINHELLHATINTMRYSGVSFSDSSEEAYTYQFQHYSTQFYNKIKP